MGMLAIAAALVFFAGLTRQVRDRLPGSLLADLTLGPALLVPRLPVAGHDRGSLEASLLPHLIGSDLASPWTLRDASCLAGTA